MIDSSIVPYRKRGISFDWLMHYIRKIMEYMQQVTSFRYDVGG